MTTTLITGANRGIGLEHVRQSLAAGETVIAGCRTPANATALHQLQAEHCGFLRIEPLDTADRTSIAALASRIRETRIDILICNAGIYGPAPWPEGAASQTLEGMDYDFWETALRVNLLGPFACAAQFLPNLRAGERKLIVMISSDLGSIANNRSGFAHAYRSSKAGLNMLVRGLAVDLRAAGIGVISLAPGWTRTDLGGADAEWALEDSIAAQRQVIAKAGLAQSGQFINLTGEILPW